MIQITRRQARMLRAVLRKSAPAGSGRSYRPALVFYAGHDGLHVRFHHLDVAAHWYLAGSREQDVIVLPGKALDDSEGGNDDIVEVARQGKDIALARWQDGVPQVRDYATIGPETLSPFPEEPKKLTSLDLTFLKAMDDAYQTVDRYNTSGSLTRVQLRGKTGEIASTDRRQLLLQRGFPFPWSESILIPASGVFGCRELLGEGPVQIGRIESHVCIRIGSWRFHFAIDKDGRFPRIEQVIPKRLGNDTTLQLAAEDAAFLAQTLPRLPGGDDDDERVTLDLNGYVALRAQAEGQIHTTEVLLSRSSSTGSAVKVVSNRQFLARALRFGFTEFYIGPNQPIVCRDRQRIFVWMPLNPEVAIAPSKDMIRINSAGVSQTVSKPPTAQRRPNPMPAPHSNGHATDDGAERSDRGQNIVDLIADAEELRSLIADFSSRAARLVSALKQHRRQTRAVQAAMHSLKQLKLDA